MERTAISSRILFVMLGKKDFRSGGYIFNFRMVEYLRNIDYNVRVIHFRTVPKGLPEHWFKASRYVCSTAAEFKPNLIVASKSYQYLPLLRLRNMFTGVPVLYLMHHMEWKDRRNRIKSTLYRLYVRWLLGMADKVWTNSRNSSVELQKAGISKKRIEILNPGFNKPKVKLPDRRDRSGPVKFVSVGCIAPRKAQKTLVEACSLFEKGTFTMEFVGSTESDPGYTATIRKAITELGMEDSIRLTGKLDAGELTEKLLNADVMVHSARWEAFGISVAEGMWLGLPVIASNVAALPELVRNGVNGLLVEPDSVSGFSDAMEFMIRNEEQRIEMGSRSREIAATMNDWHETEKQFAELVVDVLEVKGS